LEDLLENTQTLDTPLPFSQADWVSHLLLHG
jgi:hypothetical protein